MQTVRVKNLRGKLIELTSPHYNGNGGLLAVKGQRGYIISDEPNENNKVSIQIKARYYPCHNVDFDILKILD